MLVSEIITEVRRLTQDESAVEAEQRNTDAVLVSFMNQALKRIAVIRPDLFSEILTTHPCEEGFLQKIPDDGVRLIEVYAATFEGEMTAMTETSRDALSSGSPNWISLTNCGSATKFIRLSRSPKQFMISPPAPKPVYENDVFVSGQTLYLEYAKTPREYKFDRTTPEGGGNGFTADDTIDALPPAFMPTVIDATMFLVESVDDEHIQSGRARLFYDSFTAALGSATRSRLITDTEGAGLPDGEVLDGQQRRGGR